MEQQAHLQRDQLRPLLEQRRRRPQLDGLHDDRQHVPLPLRRQLPELPAQRRRSSAPSNYGNNIGTSSRSTAAISTAPPTSSTRARTAPVVTLATHHRRHVEHGDLERVPQGEGHEHRDRRRPAERAAGGRLPDDHPGHHRQPKYAPSPRLIGTMQQTLQNLNDRLHEHELTPNWDLNGLQLDGRLVRRRRSLQPHHGAESRSPASFPTDSPPTGRGGRRSTATWSPPARTTPAA